MVGGGGGEREDMHNRGVGRMWGFGFEAKEKGKGRTQSLRLKAGVLSPPPSLYSMSRLTETDTVLSSFTPVLLLPEPQTPSASVSKHSAGPKRPSSVCAGNEFIQAKD